jgi:hypothetical protein
MFSKGLRLSTSLTPHGLRRQAEYTYECPPHSFAIRKARAIASMGCRLSSRSLLSLRNDENSFRFYSKAVFAKDSAHVV